MAAATKRRSVRQAASRKRSIYAEPDTDDDFEADSEDGFQPESRAAPPPPPPPKKKRKTVSTRQRPQTRSKAKSSQTVRPIFKIGKPRRPNSKAAPLKKKPASLAILSDGKIPRWTSLPVDILRDIFVFALQPAHDQPAEAVGHASWLLRAARTCRAFALPALEAYYRSPSMLSTLQPHHFLDLLRIPKEKRFIDYNVKVKELYIDVKTLAYVAHNRPSFDLGALVMELPLLQHMEILHPMYEPPYRPLNLQRWTFPPEMFALMDQYNIRLKSWRWSRDMIPKNLDLYRMMTMAHQSKTFSRLKRLVVCGYNYADSSEPGPVENQHEPANTSLIQPGLATSIAQLPALQDLTFISCDVIMEKFLHRLPVNLQRLELSNCLEITSDMLRLFFASSGSQLRELVLNHNAALSLNFLSSLKASCPSLEVLKVDLHYYSERFTVNDAEAFYDELLSVNETPTWPSTLYHLEIVHAQKWSPEAAQNLFRSLIDSAPELLDLRRLVLHAHINIPWRDRVSFRDQWIERLRRVYLRRCEEPFSHLGSFRQYRLWKWKQQNRGPTAASSSTSLVRHDDMDELAGTPLKGWSGRSIIEKELSQVQISPHKPSGETDVYSDSDHFNPQPPGRQPRRSKRVAQSQIDRASKSATPMEEESESEPEDESEADDWRRQPEKFIHGLCEVVDVRIDNQRPRENQWTEGDFLDSEISGDEDWREGDDSGPEESYAW